MPVRNFGGRNIMYLVTESLSPKDAEGFLEDVKRECGSEVEHGVCDGDGRIRCIGIGFDGRSGGYAMGL